MSQPPSESDRPGSDRPRTAGPGPDRPEPDQPRWRGPADDPDMSPGYRATHTGRPAPSPERRGATGAQPRRSRVQRRRDRIAAEIQANRRGEYSVPTWVLALILAAVIAGWIALIVFG